MLFGSTERRVGDSVRHLRARIGTAEVSRPASRMTVTAHAFGDREDLVSDQAVGLAVHAVGGLGSGASTRQKIFPAAGSTQYWR